MIFKSFRFALIIILAAFALNANAALIGDTVLIEGNAVIVSDTDVEYTSTSSYSLLYEQPHTGIDYLLFSGTVTRTIDIGGPEADIVLTIAATMNFDDGLLANMSPSGACAQLEASGFGVEDQCAYWFPQDRYDIDSLDWDGESHLTGYTLIEEPFYDPYSPYQPPLLQYAIGGTATSINMEIHDMNIWCDGCTVTKTLSIDLLSAPNVPIPAAVWLFGSGLLGLVGVARRKKV